MKCWIHTRQPATHTHTSINLHVLCLPVCVCVYVYVVPIQAVLKTAVCPASSPWQDSVTMQATAPVPSLSCRVCSAVCDGSSSTPTNSRGRCLHEESRHPRFTTHSRQDGFQSSFDTLPESVSSLDVKGPGQHSIDLRPGQTGSTRGQQRAQRE